MAFDNEYSEYQHRGSVLATQALEKLQKGDFEGFKTDWEEANENMKLFLASINSEAGKRSIMYGENRNFGIIMDVILENASVCGYGESENILPGLKKIIKEIKTDKILKTQFDMYNEFTNKNLWEGRNTDNAKGYVNTVETICETLDRKEVFEHNEKLIGMIKEYGLDENVLIDDETMKLYESIECILLNGRNISKVHELMEAKDNISEYIKEHMITDKKEPVDFDKKVKELSEKYEKELNDKEKQLIEMVETTEDKEGLFNDFKKRTLNTLSESLKTYDGEDHQELKLVIEKIENKTFNKKTLLVDLSEMIEVMDVMNG